ncbi:FAD-dependent oxidoreductase [uncultured Desulfosarcina sp.]|uniref:NAD(P)/FAD-dependent oxidoreductase n=1 Tax=uncultured Desulfosarcina sp. TaxID=218289 RepID=UPI0029C8C538|nr:FAD-dependent oxidoreductase [uncultured Desulfosarcina sp.]
MRKILTPDAFDQETADAVVIGGGIIGVATAFWLSRAGFSTILVEMRNGLSTLTTTASIESFRAQFTEPAMAALAKESIEVWENFAQTTGLEGYEIDLHHGGYLFLTTEENMVADVKATVEAYHKVGVTDSEYLSGGEILNRWPWLSPEIKAGAFRAKDGWFSAHEVTQGFARAAEKARFYVRTRATGIETDNQGVCAVLTDRGRINTRVVVNAAGPFAINVGRWVGLDLPIYQMRRQRVFVAPHPKIPQNAPLIMDVDNESYWRPETGGALLGWHDPDEQKSDPMEDPPGDWDFPAFTLEMCSRLSPFWREVVDDLKQEDLSVYAGQYVHAPDDQPLIGPVADIPGFYLNCAYWPGVMLSAAAGRWTCDLITGKMKPEENPLRLSRFEEGLATPPGAFMRGRH